nr:unnamed protein product [Spirometra erinaceieuropaei]
MEIVEGSFFIEEEEDDEEEEEEEEEGEIYAQRRRQTQAESKCESKKQLTPRVHKKSILAWRVRRLAAVVRQSELVSVHGIQLDMPVDALVIRVHRLEEFSAFLERADRDNASFVPSESVPGVQRMHGYLRQMVSPLYCQLVLMDAC